MADQTPTPPTSTLPQVGATVTGEQIGAKPGTTFVVSRVTGENVYYQQFENGHYLASGTKDIASGTAMFAGATKVTPEVLVNPEAYGQQNLYQVAPSTSYLNPNIPVPSDLSQKQVSQINELVGQASGGPQASVEAQRALQQQAASLQAQVPAPMVEAQPEFKPIDVSKVKPFDETKPPSYLPGAIKIGEEQSPFGKLDLFLNKEGTQVVSVNQYGQSMGASSASYLTFTPEKPVEQQVIPPSLSSALFGGITPSYAEQVAATPEGQILSMKAITEQYPEYKIETRPIEGGTETFLAHAYSPTQAMQPSINVPIAPEIGAAIAGVGGPTVGVNALEATPGFITPFTPSVSRDITRNLGTFEPLAPENVPASFFAAKIQERTGISGSEVYIGGLRPESQQGVTALLKTPVELVSGGLGQAERYLYNPQEFAITAAEAAALTVAIGVVGAPLGAYAALGSGATEAAITGISIEGGAAGAVATVAIAPVFAAPFGVMAAQTAKEEGGTGLGILGTEAAVFAGVAGFEPIAKPLTETGAFLRQKTPIIGAKPIEVPLPSASRLPTELQPKYLYDVEIPVGAEFGSKAFVKGTLFEETPLFLQSAELKIGVFQISSPEKLSVEELPFVTASFEREVLRVNDELAAKIVQTGKGEIVAKEGVSGSLSEIGARKLVSEPFVSKPLSEIIISKPSERVETTFEFPLAQPVETKTLDIGKEVGFVKQPSFGVSFKVGEQFVSEIRPIAKGNELMPFGTIIAEKETVPLGKPGGLLFGEKIKSTFEFDVGNLFKGSEIIVGTKGKGLGKIKTKGIYEGFQAQKLDQKGKTITVEELVKGYVERGKLPGVLGRTKVTEKETVKVRSGREIIEEMRLKTAAKRLKEVESEIGQPKIVTNGIGIQIPKEKEKPRGTITPKISPMLKIETELKPEVYPSLKYSPSSGLKTILPSKQVIPQSQLQPIRGRIKELPTTITVQKQALRGQISELSTQIQPPITPPPNIPSIPSPQIPIPKIPIGGGLWLPSGFYSQGRSSIARTRRKKTSYTPDLTALALGIYGKVNKKATFTGAELRPIPINSMQIPRMTQMKMPKTKIKKQPKINLFKIPRGFL